MWLDVHVPPNYTPADERHALIIARQDVRDDILDAYRNAPPTNPTLHGYAAAVPDAGLLQGRDAAYAIVLPTSGMAVVVRHNRHGGAFRSLTGDLFIAPTRAPDELAMALELRARGIPTPAVVAYGIYPVAMGFARADVVTQAIPDSADFGAVLLATQPESDDRLRAWNAVRRLMKRLASAGARHHDFNVKNILLRRTEDGLFGAYVLDVDRMALDYTRRDAYAGNRARLRRSVEKWRDTRGATISAAEIETLRHTVPSIP
jgi:tRNA A-37 threonylcarbamoyl transferase component Bud32